MSSNFIAPTCRTRPESIENAAGADTAFGVAVRAEAVVRAGLGVGVGSAATDAISGLEDASVTFGVATTSRVWRLDGATANMAESLSVYTDILGLPCERFWQPGPFSEDVGFIDLPGVDWRKPIVINVSRGGLIDTQALIRGLQANQLSGAGLDVLEHEPEVPGELLQLENVIVTPHAAWYSVEASNRLRRTAITDIIRVLSGQKPLYPVPA